MWERESHRETPQGRGMGPEGEPRVSSSLPVPTATLHRGHMKEPFLDIYLALPPGATPFSLSLHTP